MKTIIAVLMGLLMAGCALDFQPQKPGFAQSEVPQSGGASGPGGDSGSGASSD